MATSEVAALPAPLQPAGRLAMKPLRQLAPGEAVDAGRELEHLLHASAALTGEPFLARVVADLARALEVRHLYVAEVRADDGCARVLALHSEDGPVPAFDYTLDGTLCELVSRGEELFLGRGAATRLPQEALPFQATVDAYFGVPLGTPGQAPVGLLVGMHDGPIQLDAQARVLVRLLAARMGAEIRRIREERERQKEFGHGRRLVNALNRLALSQELHEGRVEAFARNVARTLVRVMDVRSVSVWLRVPESGLMEALASASATGTVVPVTPGMRLEVGEEYFDKRQRIRTVTPDMQSDLAPGVQDFLSRRRVGEHVEGAIRVQGSVAGIVAVVPRAEGPRPGPLDMNFIADVSDLLARAETEARRMAEEDLRRTLELELARARKVEALGSLAGGIAHDFNNILTAMLGNAELALLDAGPDLRGPLEDIVASGNRGREVIAQIFQFVHSESLETSEVDLRQLVEEVIRTVRPLAGETRVKLHTQEPASVIRGDRAQLTQVVLNLCTNALTALAGSGTLELEIRRARRDELTSHPVLRGEPCHILRVRDDGPGIPEELQEKIFEPFFSTRKQSGGTGLGLAIVDRVVQAHGGTVELESVDGAGTTFNLLLPLDAG